MGFRKDINGLRAIAVIAVVIFHFNPSWIPGGFSGVDVFFVISGFLMTGIIFRGIESNSFSIFRFYISRANRLLPSLAILCLALLIFGWFYLTPVDYRLLSKHATTSIGFISNILYHRELGYFEAASHDKWLLHTWSLSVEWQFYIFYPMLILFLSKFISLERLKALLLVSTVIGFLLCVYTTFNSPNAAYYLLPSRIWEMMAGGVVYLYPLKMGERQKRLAQVLGLIAIVSSFMFVSSETPWPGYFALLPVLGTCLVIMSSQEDSILTGNLAFFHIGKWSYSIYLWHWPLVVYGYLKIENWWLIGGGLTILLGFLNFKLVESIKFPVITSLKGVFKSVPLYLGGGVASLTLLVFLFNGFSVPYRSAANTAESLYLDKYNISNYVTPAFRKLHRHECGYFDEVTYKAKIHEIDDSCIAGKPNSGGIFLWGDSHAQALSYGLSSYFPNEKFSQVATSGCRPLVEEDIFTKNEPKKACDHSNIKALEAIIRLNPKVVILAQARRHDENNYFKIAQVLKESGVTSKLILIGPVPQWDSSLPKAIVMRHMNVDDKKFDDPYFYDELWGIDAHLKSKYLGKDIEYISLLSSLCSGRACLAKVDDKNTPIVWDYGHLSLEGSIYVVKNIVGPKIELLL